MEHGSHPIVRNGRNGVSFLSNFTSAQVSEFFNRHKNPSDSWHTHYLYLMAVRNATGASASLIPENLVMHAIPELRPVLASHYDRKRSDFVVHALKLHSGHKCTKTMKSEYREQKGRGGSSDNDQTAHGHKDMQPLQHRRTHRTFLSQSLGERDQRRDATMGTGRTGSRKSHRRRLDRRLWRKHPSGER